MTGAPKIEAMTILEAARADRARRLLRERSAGSISAVPLDLSVVIRTIVVKDGRRPRPRRRRDRRRLRRRPPSTTRRCTRRVRCSPRWRLRRARRERSSPATTRRPGSGLRRDVLVVDNYDSFTWNLVQLVGALGERPVVVPERRDRSRRASARSRRHASSSRPARATPQIRPASASPAPSCTSSAVTRPILGVCLGHQLIVHALRRARDSCAAK